MAKGTAKKTAAAGDGRSKEGVVEKVDGMAPVKGGGGGDLANEVVVSVPVHCEGCARKMRRSLLRTEGFEEVIVNNSTNTVVVTGQKALEDPMMVVERVERRTRKKALLLSPSPAKLPPPSAVKNKDTKKEAAKADMKNDVTELDMKMGVVMKIEMHCEACSEEMKRRILNIKGVEEAVPHMKSSELMVKGAVEPATLVGFIHKCTGKKAAIIRAEPLDLPPASAMTAPMGEKTTADANAKQQEPSDNLKEKNEGVKEETKQEEVKGGGGEGQVQNVDEKTKTEIQDKGDGDGVEKEKTQEKNQMKDHQFKLPVQDAVVAVAPEAGLYEYYYHPPYAYAYPQYAYQQYQYPYAGHPAAMYRPYPHYPPAPQTLSDENPEACTIM
ncbi:heavy metal-associated isoprenylated plant protein 7-like [Lolium rigidum]|uniref:heavy metal-associated isoprenylated plant protein 7-like n=1 Tax=Lolium rigidum TaxID=89674 RepID=UPI001F5CB374|nr:heavy metal-associated isoprenylated plant protein 7-like [Lolium rigidum]